MSKVSFSFNDSKMVRAEWSLKAQESCGGGGNFKFPEETDQREAVVERFKRHINSVCKLGAYFCQT